MVAQREGHAAHKCSSRDMTPSDSTASSMAPSLLGPSQKRKGAFLD